MHNPASTVRPQIQTVCFRIVISEFSPDCSSPRQKTPLHSTAQPRIGPGLDEPVLESINRTVLARVFWEDRAFMSSTRLRQTFSLRLCIVNHTTTWDDVRETLEAVERFGVEALAKGSGS